MTMMMISAKCMLAILTVAICIQICTCILEYILACTNQLSTILVTMHMPTLPTCTGSLPHMGTTTTGTMPSHRITVLDVHSLHTRDIHLHKRITISESKQLFVVFRREGAIVVA